MIRALQVLLLLGALGGLDTLYYHEWKLRLPRVPTARRELRLHAARDFAYAIVFGSLAWATWNGILVWPLAGILLFEIVITLTRFYRGRSNAQAAGWRAGHACGDGNRVRSFSCIAIPGGMRLAAHAIRVRGCGLWNPVVGADFLRRWRAGFRIPRSDLCSSVEACFIPGEGRERLLRPPHFRSSVLHPFPADLLATSSLLTRHVLRQPCESQRLQARAGAHNAATAPAATSKSDVGSGASVDASEFPASPKSRL